MDTPRKTNLYRQIAKDYTPKQADMMICKYIEGLEQRIEALEAKLARPEPSNEPEESKVPAKGRKKTAAGASASTATSGEALQNISSAEPTAYASTTNAQPPDETVTLT